MKSIKLVYEERPSGLVNETIKRYKVIVVKNSVAYHPGQILQRDEVDMLCAKNVWDVTIVSDNKSETART